MRIRSSISLFTCMILALAAAMVAAANPASATPPPAGNVIQLANGTIVPVYTVTGSATVSAVGFKILSGQVTAYDQSGNILWQKPTDQTHTGFQTGFDYDGDGWPDLALPVYEPTGGTCGISTIYTSTLYFYSGQNGALQTPLSPQADICWSFQGTTPYPTKQYTTNTVKSGTGTSDLLISPQYATTSWFLRYTSGSFVTDGALYYPSTSSYDAEYPAAVNNAYGTGTKYVTYSHVANGLFTTVNSQTRALFWTTARVVQYNLGPLATTQLAADNSYLTGGRTDIGGRNYGVVAVDPVNTNNIGLIAGTANLSLYQDMYDGVMQNDPYGGIERHVSLYHPSTNAVTDQFYSYYHDNSDGNGYINRVSFPANPWIKTGGSASRLAYNVYSGGHWYLHITEPGSLTDRYALKDMFLWDISDVNGDGVDELVTSPTRYTNEPDVPGYYLPHWQTDLQSWTEGTQALSAFRTYSNAIPRLDTHGVTATTTTSDDGLYPVQIAVSSGGVRSLAMLTSSKTTVFTP